MDSAEPVFRLTRRCYHAAGLIAANLMREALLGGKIIPGEGNSASRPIIALSRRDVLRQLPLDAVAQRFVCTFDLA
jgi:hypothetical protein